MAVTRLKDRKRQAIVSNIIGGVFCFMAVGVSAVFLMYAPMFMVRDVSVVGNEVVEKVDVESAVRAIVVKKYFGIIPVATTLFYPKDRIVRAIASSSPRIKNATVDIRDGVAFVAITERKTYAVWCYLKTVSPCFLLDDDGIIFAEAPLMEGSSLLRYSGGVSSTTPVRLGMQYLETKDAFLEIRFLLNELRSKEIEVTEIAIDPIGSVSVVSKNKTVFLIGRKNDFTAALGRLDATFADPAIPVRQLYQEGKLETLDIRFLGKALFKERKL